MRNLTLGCIIVVREDTVLSRAGMELTVSASPPYEGWVTSGDRSADIKEAIKDRDTFVMHWLYCGNLTTA